MACALLTMVMNVETLYLNMCLHQTLCAAAAAVAVVVALYDSMDEQPALQLSQQRLLQQYQCDDFGVG